MWCGHDTRSSASHSLAANRGKQRGSDAEPECDHVQYMSASARSCRRCGRRQQDDTAGEGRAATVAASNTEPRAARDQQPARSESINRRAAVGRRPAHSTLFPLPHSVTHSDACVHTDRSHGHAIISHWWRDSSSDVVAAPSALLRSHCRRCCRITHCTRTRHTLQHATRTQLRHTHTHTKHHHVGSRFLSQGRPHPPDRSVTDADTATSAATRASLFG